MQGVLLAFCSQFHQKEKAYPFREVDPFDILRAVTGTDPQEKRARVIGLSLCKEIT
ncbi:hypothetical protein BRIN106911_06965 [Brevibacillus invocatus]